MLSKAQGLGKKTAERIVASEDKVLPKGSTIPATESGNLIGDNSSVDHSGLVGFECLLGCCFGIAY